MITAIAGAAGARTGRLRPLAAAFALALALESAPNEAKTTHATSAPTVQVVSNCSDSGSGSLRDAVDNASDGDTIDLTQLQCSVISLSTGAILIGVTGLTLEGPGNHQLMIQGFGNSGFGILYDLGGGTLTVDGVDISFGAKYRSDNAARGGCIYTNGDLQVNDAHIYACGVHANTYPAYGGAIAAAGTVTMMNTQIDLCGLTTSGVAKGGGVFGGEGVFMSYSSVSGCRVATTGRGYGGGVYSGGDLFVKYSTIADNENDEATYNDGGGTFSRGNATVYWSTISGNRAKVGGGLYMAASTTGLTATFGESTISNNYAQAAGGVRSAPSIFLYNSTIAFNSGPRAYSIPIGYAPTAGLSLRGASAFALSTIIANNVAHGAVADDEEDVGGDLSIPVGGSANLIMSSDQPVPADTITDDPRLAPLADNGGLTRTHELLSGSPAIDHGNAGLFTTDQRGSGFPRVLGNGADIGAFESDPDVIFRNGFD